METQTVRRVKTGVLVLLFVALVLGMSFCSNRVAAAPQTPIDSDKPALYEGDYLLSPGAIWTTRLGCGIPEQDVNHFTHGEWVYINGAGFTPGSYPWTITGQPGGASADPGIVVAPIPLSDVVIDETGAFCFAAYQVANDDGGEYSVKVGNKGDNYRVDWPTAIVSVVVYTYLDVNLNGKVDLGEAPIAWEWAWHTFSQSGSLKTGEDGVGILTLDVMSYTELMTLNPVLPDGWETVCPLEYVTLLNYTMRPIEFGVFPKNKIFLPIIYR